MSLINQIHVRNISYSVWVDYVRPIEVVIPGVQGRVLGVLARTEAELTIRTAARLAGVSAQQASVVLNRLVDLGLVTRREAGSAALVRLDRENDAARAVLALVELHRSTMSRLAELAAAMSPAPASLIVFGSFARGQATAESDLDVLVVRHAAMAADDEAWLDGLGAFEQAARHVGGNPVDLLVVGADEVATLLSSESGPWRAIVSEGVVLVGSTLSVFGSAA